MNWVFVLVVLGTPHGATAESVGLDSREQCLSYARGRLSTLPPAHTALCVGRRAAEVVGARNTTPTNTSI